jgi:hypothetical protein
MVPAMVDVLRGENLMPRLSFLAGALLMLLALPFGGAKAALIGLDSPFGPRTLIRDTDTGHDWLALTVTEGMPSRALFAALAPGGLFAGFRVADIGEVTDLVQAFIYADNPLGDYDRALEFIDLWRAGAGGSSLHGLAAPITPGEEGGTAPGTFLAFGALLIAYEDRTVYFDTQLNASGIPLDRATDPFFLVSSANAVPEPASWTLFVSAAAAALLRRKLGHPS